MSIAETIELVYKSLPYSNQITDIDLSEDNVIRFKWIGETYRVSDSGFVETVGNGVLIGCDKSILVEELIKKTRIISSLQG